ncbi:hypothetical protein OH492_06490 [Vibrio chagasii]|nr:hypothetical protein [Vibrio chagasii]
MSVTLATLEATKSNIKNLHSFNPQRDSVDDVPTVTFPNLFCFIGL